MDKTDHNSLSQLDKIIDNLCAGIDIPQRKDINNDHAAERLIEQVELNGYPFAPLTCDHLLEKGIGEDCVECQQKQYDTYKSRFKNFVNEKGLEHTHTLKAAFDYYSTLITRYFLTECDQLLDRIYSSCIARGSWSAFYIMAIQARAFLRFKQSRYKESLDYFQMQIDALGPNEMIYENMALAYSRLDELKNASICYAQAILLIRQKPVAEQQFSTLLMGLATVLDNSEDSLIVLHESMRLLKERFDKPHSLMAKTLGAMGDLYLKINDVALAEKCFREAVDIFIETCGYDTPLTSNAMNKLAKTLLVANRNQEAADVFLKALNVWAKVDNESFDPNRVVEALMAISNQYTQNAGANKISGNEIAAIDSIQEKIIHNPIFNSDLNVLCLLKFIYELHIINRDIPRAITSCQSFVELLEKLDESQLNELVAIRDRLLNEAVNILNIMKTM